MRLGFPLASGLGSLRLEFAGLGLWTRVIFHLVKTMLYFPLLIFKGIYHYWKIYIYIYTYKYIYTHIYIYIYFPGDLSKWRSQDPNPWPVEGLGSVFRSVSGGSCWTLGLFS